MKALIVATGHKPKNFVEELQAGQRYRIDYLELCERLPASYVDYDPPWMHDHGLIRKLEEKIHIDFFWAYEIAQKVKRENFDLVISMSERVAVPLGLMLDSHVKHVVILLNTMEPKWLKLIKLLHLQKSWSHIIVFSRAEAVALKKELSIGSDKISNMLNYVDLDFFDPAGIELDPQLDPFCISHGLSKRDYPTLIRAMQKIPEVHCKLSAVSAWDKFKAGYEGMDIPPNVHLESFNHPALIKNIIAQSRFVVIPLRTDTGMWCAGTSSVIQAQAMGKPVVVTYLPGIADYVKDGETGYLVKGEDPDALAQAIERLWKNPQQAAEMGRNARQWMAESFGLKTYLDQFAALVNKQTEKINLQSKTSSVDIKTKPRMST